MGAYVTRWIAEGPRRAKAFWCTFVPYPLCLEKWYPGYCSSSSFIYSSRATLAMMDAAAIDLLMLSPRMMGVQGTEPGMGKASLKIQSG